MAAGKDLNYGRMFFIMSIFIAAFSILGRNIDVYHYAFVGALFEFLWLPALGILVALPVLVLVHWIKEKCSLRSLHFYSLLVLVPAVIIVFFKD